MAKITMPKITHSLTTIVVHSRDGQEVSVAHEVKSPENQPVLVKPVQTSFQINLKYFQKVAMKL